MSVSDEVDLDHNHISWASPLGRALTNAKEDDEIILRAPGGTQMLTVLEVRYQRIPVAPFCEPDGSAKSSEASPLAKASTITANTAVNLNIE